MSCYLWRLCGVQNLWTLEYLKTSVLCIASVSYSSNPDNEVVTLIAYYSNLAGQLFSTGESLTVRLLLSAKTKHYWGYAYLGHLTKGHICQKRKFDHGKYRHLNEIILNYCDEIYEFHQKGQLE